MRFPCLALLVGFAVFLGSALAGGKAPSTAGVFTGIESGDYAHFRITTAKKEDVSFFILEPDPSVEKVLAKPEKFVGRPCRVTWRRAKADIPEAGGRIEVTEILGVEWLKPGSKP